MGTDAGERFGLVAAARALEEALAAFEAEAAGLESRTLCSDGELEGAAEALRRVVSLGEGVQLQVQALISTFTRVREGQQARAQAVQARAATLSERTMLWHGLLARFDRLGQEAAALHLLARQVLAGALGPEAPSFTDLQARVESVVAVAEQLSVAAEHAEFPSLTRQAEDFLRQLFATRERLALLRRQLVR